MSDQERETLEIDVLFVGAGPASLAGAYHLAGLLREHNATAAAEKLEVSIAVLEKGREIGSHALSGRGGRPARLARAVPGRLAERAVRRRDRARARGGPLPHREARGRTADPAAAARTTATTWPPSASSSSGWPPRSRPPGSTSSSSSPPPGPWSRTAGWSACAPATRASPSTGEKKANYEPGVDIRAQVTVLGEGPRGTLAKQLDADLDLWQGQEPAGLRASASRRSGTCRRGGSQPGQVIHTMGWPLGFDTFGGGFIYGMQNDQVDRRPGRRPRLQEPAARSRTPSSSA